MHTGAIICEYNPLHNGHAYHIQQTKQNGITHLLAILSDDFVQRGEPALCNKFQRAKLAIQAGADLVLELPVPYSCASAELYARGAIQLLQNLNMLEYLSFGCSGNLAELQALASVTVEDSPELQMLLKTGNSYPSAMYQVMKNLVPEQANLLLDPNNLLALEYLKAMRNLHVPFQPMSITRNSVLHDSEITSGALASASLIRKKFFAHEDYQAYIPDFTAETLANSPIAEISHLEKIILYQMRMLSESELLTLPDMTPELAGKFLKAKSANSLEEFLFIIKSKAFTMARIKRVILYALLKIQKSDLQIPIPYGRILAFNRNGTELLKLCKQRSIIPLHTSLAELRTTSPQAERFAEIETNTANLYGLAQTKITSAECEFRQKIKLMY